MEGEATAAVECGDCENTVVVTLTGLEWLDADDPGLDIDVCIGTTCGQALVDVVPLPTGTYPDSCTADDDEVACCFSSPVDVMPACSAQPGGAVQVQISLPPYAKAGTTLPVHATIRNMLADWLGSRDGEVTLTSCGPSCVSGATVL